MTDAPDTKKLMEKNESLIINHMVFKAIRLAGEVAPVLMIAVSVTGADITKARLQRDVVAKNVILTRGR